MRRTGERYEWCTMARGWSAADASTGSPPSGTQSCRALWCLLSLHTHASSHVYLVAERVDSDWRGASLARLHGRVQAGGMVGQRQHQEAAHCTPSACVGLKGGRLSGLLEKGEAIRPLQHRARPNARAACCQARSSPHLEAPHNFQQLTMASMVFSSASYHSWFIVRPHPYTLRYLQGVTAGNEPGVSTPLHRCSWAVLDKAVHAMHVAERKLPAFHGTTTHGNPTSKLTQAAAALKP